MKQRWLVLERLGPRCEDSKLGVTRWLRVTADIHAVWQHHNHLRTENAYLEIAKYAQADPQRRKTNIYYT